MQKDFREWHEVKQEIQNFYPRRFYREREIRWCSVGLNVGSEIDGKGKNYMRPVLILKRISRNTCLCVPITTQNHIGPHYFEINLKDGIKRIVALSQIRLFDTKRLYGLIERLDPEQFQKIKQAVINVVE